jgi:hypothetical protein
MLSYRPAVLARQPGQQSHHERPRPAPRLYLQKRAPARVISSVVLLACLVFMTSEKPAQGVKPAF